MRTISAILRHILVSALTAAIAVGPAATGWAGPSNITGGNGKASMVHVDNSNVWTVTAPNGSIIHFSGFDIKSGETVTFVQPSADSRALNRIFSAAPTRIDGTLTANGQIYIVNPAGVFFGSGSQVNVAGLQAAAGHLSDRDFSNNTDHFTGLRGRVENAGQITAGAVSLVGGKVSNSGSVTADGGWIIMAAGRDVLIGRDDNKNGILLRVEGAAGAVFSSSATGVENTGTLEATPDATTPSNGGKVTLGAGDLYGTAIFSKGAIHARELALQADDRGNVALGGDVTANTLGATFGGNSAGKLVSAGAAGTTQTINADTVNLLATGAKGNLQVGAGLQFRGVTDPTAGPTAVNAEQKAGLKTSSLKNLEIGDAARGQTAVTLKSSSGVLTVDDRTLVKDTQLSLTGQSVIDIKGRDPLEVASLTLQASTTESDASLIATAGDIDAHTNLGFSSDPAGRSDPTVGILLAAHNGDITVDSDITTSNGGLLRIEGKKVAIGTVDDTGARHGGIIDISGSIAPRLEIGFTDASGAQQTQTVAVTAINTTGRKHAEKDAPTAGGDVTIDATGDVIVRDSIDTRGEPTATGTSAPTLSGGSVRISSGSQVTVGSVQTGGGDPPTAPSAGQPATPEHGEIALSAPLVVVTGNLDAHDPTTGNTGASRDRSVTIDGELELGANNVTIVGGDIALKKGVHPGLDLTDPNKAPVARTVALELGGTGITSTGGDVTADSLAIDNTTGDVILGGNVTSNTSFTVAFNTPGTGVLRSNGPISVQSNKIVLTASDSSNKDTHGNAAGTTASVSVGPDLSFVLVDRAATDTIAALPGSVTLGQDGAISAATTNVLSRFSVLPTSSTTPLPGLGGESVTLRSSDSVSLDANARTAVAGSNLTIDGKSFSTDAGSGLNLASLSLTSNGQLDVNFDVTASGADGIRLASGVAGDGDLNVSSKLSADSISLIAGDGPGGTTKPAVTFADTAQLRAHDGVSNPVKVAIVEDADVDKTTLPTASVFGGPGALLNLDYEISSLDGSVDIDGADIAGSNLSITGQNGITFGSSLPILASLTASTPQALELTSNLTTAPGGKIELHAATADGSKDNLEIGSTAAGAQQVTLAADQISLFAGSANGSDTKSRVILDGNVLFRNGTTDTTSAPA
ncbi:MAG: filamentous hemagglutinin N-terminal domain-containing protein, partial [Myxococcota bacterium]